MYAWVQDEAGGANQSFFWSNGVYNPYSTNDTWDGAYSSPSASAALKTFAILDMGGGDTVNIDSQARDGTKLGGWFMWEGGKLSKANLDAFYSATKGRYGL